jgi:hypothetical protein
MNPALAEAVGPVKETRFEVTTMKTFQSSLVLASVLALSTVMAGCGTYRVVRRTPNGGEVALQGTESKAREAAAEYMASVCPEGYDVLEEGEAVIGTETDAQTQRGRVYGVPTTTTTATTTDKHEWRIKYQCRGGSTANGVAATGKQGSIQQFTIRY